MERPKDMLGASSKDPKEPTDPDLTFGDIAAAGKRCLTVAIRKCVGAITKGAPPEPDEDVQELLSAMTVAAPDFKQMYDVFHLLAQSESPESIITIATVVEVESCQRMIGERRRWVSRILRQLLTLGDNESTITWDDFLYLFMRFCSLTRVELCQAFFLIIVNELNSPRQHYLTRQQLREYYTFYKKCSVKSFCTQSIDFNKLPLSRYYVTDFVELIQRFTCLLNPIVHLQENLQGLLPSLEFWEQYDPPEQHCRKVTAEFFCREKTRVFLRGEPPFQESCDMLAPDALGFLAVNKDQWNMRAPHAAMPILRQISVWGEQQRPEDFELGAKKAGREHASGKEPGIETALPSKGQATPAALLPTPVSPQPVPALSAPPAPTSPVGSAGPPWRLPGPPIQGGACSPQPTLRRRGLARGAEALPSLGPDASPMEMSIFAARQLEEDSFPPEHLPPRWMQRCTIAPAPAPPYPNPPLEALATAPNEVLTLVGFEGWRFSNPSAIVHVKGFDGGVGEYHDADALAILGAYSILAWDGDPPEDSSFTALISAFLRHRPERKAIAFAQSDEVQDVQESWHRQSAEFKGRIIIVVVDIDKEGASFGIRDERSRLEAFPKQAQDRYLLGRIGLKATRSKEVVALGGEGILGWEASAQLEEGVRWTVFALSRGHQEEVPTIMNWAAKSSHPLLAFIQGKDPNCQQAFGSETPIVVRTKPIVGDRVKLVRNYTDFPSAKIGPLEPEEIGHVLEDDKGDVPYRVLHPDGRQKWWYETLSLAVLLDPPAPPPPSMGPKPGDFVTTRVRGFRTERAICPRPGCGAPAQIGRARCEQCGARWTGALAGEDADAELRIAASEGRAEECSKLMTTSSDMNAFDEDGVTATMMAARHGRLAVLQVMVDQRANICARDRFGNTALDFAREESHDACVQFLCEATEKSQELS